MKGPSGAGKTTTISCLAKAMDFDILEWRNPIGSDYSSEGYLSMSARFDDFLGRSGRFNTLAIASNNGVVSTTAKDTMKEITRTKIVLIEEFPNTFLNPSSALRSFRSNILEYLIVNSPAMNPLSKKCQNFDHVVTPAVMIITETRLNTTTAASDNFTAHQLLGSEILSHPCVSIVEFNPIAPTLLTKALELVVTKEARHSGRRRISGPAVLKKLSETGDVRSAVGSLEFLCLRLEDGDGLGGRGAYRSKRGVNLPALTKLERESLEVVSLRESSLGLFHAVGKVVYNKRKDFSTIDTGGEPPRVPANDSPDHVRLRVSQVSVDHLIDETDTDIGTFIAALHENYVLSCEGGTFMDSLNGCLDVLSDCDILGSPKGSRLGSAGAHSSRSFQGAATDLVRQDEICFHIAVRGLLYALPDPVKRLTYPASGKMGVRNEAYTMFYPTSIRLSRQIEEIESLVCRWTSRFRVGINLFGHAKHDPSRQFAASTIRGQGPCSADNAGHPSEACENDIEPLRTSLGCTKHEMVLERLPYITRIVQGNRTSPHFNELDRITQFRGVNALIEECSDDDDSEVPSATPEWNTDLPAGGNAVIPALAGLQSEVTEVGKEANTQVFSVESDIGKLYLSEDDIEDE